MQMLQNTLGELADGFAGNIISSGLSKKSNTDVVLCVCVLGGDLSLREQTSRQWLGFPSDKVLIQVKQSCWPASVGVFWSRVQAEGDKRSACFVCCFKVSIESATAPPESSLLNSWWCLIETIKMSGHFTVVLHQHTVCLCFFFIDIPI